MKHFTLCLKWLFLSLMLCVSVGAMADEPITITISSFSGLPTNAAYATYNWSSGNISGKATIYANTKSTSMQFNASNYLFYSTSAIDGRITSIKLTTASGTNRTYSVYGSTTAYTGSGTSYGTLIDSQTVTTSGTTFSVSTGDYTYFTIVKTGTGAGYLSSVVVNYEAVGGNALPSAEFSFPKDSYEITLGDEFDGPTVSTADEYDGTPEYSSSDETVAEVNSSTGAVTVKKAGTVTISASAEATENFAAGLSSYTLTVNPAPVDGIIDFTSGLTYGSGLKTTNDGNYYESSASTWTAGNITVVIEGKYRWWSDKTMRFYSTSPQSTFTVSAPAEKTITEIVVDGAGKSAFTSNVGTYTSGTWTGNANSVVFTRNSESGGKNINSITVTYGDPAVTISEALYATYNTPVPVSFAALDAYIISAASSTSATLTKVTEAPANTAVIINGSEGTHTLTYKANAASVGTNLLRASDGTVEGNGSSIYVLADGDNGVGFYLLAAGDKLPAGKAYLNTSSAAAKAFIGFNFDGLSNAIEGVTIADELSAGHIYNLAGQQMKSLQKGINIVNGKKIYVK